jgi:hypothetical protein
MTGSSLVPIVVPIVAFCALAVWFGLVFYADAHPGWKSHQVAPGTGAEAGEQPAARELTVAASAPQRGDAAQVPQAPPKRAA